MKNTIFNINEETIVITGASGQLGLFYTRALLEQSANVIAIDINKAEDFENLEKIYLNKFLYLDCDITSKDSLKDALDSINEKFSSTPTVLINNAALDSPPDSSGNENCSFENYSEELWDKVISVDMKGNFLCSQVFGHAMSQNKTGSIINISSIYGLLSPDQSLYDYRRKNNKEFYKPVAYAASKYGILNLTRYLAVYWAKKNVRVNTLSLGGIFNNQDKQFIENYNKRVPIGRLANPDDIIGAIIYLSSSASQYVTGSNIVIDGGWTAI